MSNRETVEIISRLLRDIARIAHDSLDDRLKLGAPQKAVELERDALNQLFGQVTDKVREIEE